MENFGIRYLIREILVLAKAQGTCRAKVDAVRHLAGIQQVRTARALLRNLELLVPIIQNCPTSGWGSA